MASKKKLSKKFLLTADFRGLTKEEKLTKETNMTLAQIDNPTLVPGLTPTGLTVQAQIVVLTDPNTGLIHQHDVMAGQLYAMTEDIDKKITAIKDIIVSKWMPQTEAALTATPALALIAEKNAKLLLFGVKGVAGGAAQTSSVMEMGKTAESKPVIARIDTNVKGQHTLHEHNSITGKIGHPKKTVLRIDVYGQTGGIPPANLTDLIKNGGGWLGTIKRGKFVNVYTVTTGTGGNKGLEEYYILVYIDAVTLKPAAQSKTDSAPIE
ncbi:MAG TPA: hypothetical protein VF411_15395 [Bacteroidia bacterium]